MLLVYVISRVSAQSFLMMRIEGNTLGALAMTPQRCAQGWMYSGDGGVENGFSKSRSPKMVTAGDQLVPA